MKRFLFLLLLCSLFLGAWGQTTKVEENLKVLLPLSYLWVDVNQNEEIDFGYDIIYSFKEKNGEADIAYFPNGWKDSCIALFTFPAESGLEPLFFKEKGIKVWQSEGYYFVCDKNDHPLFELVLDDENGTYMLSISDPKIYKPSDHDPSPSPKDN